MKLLDSAIFPDPESTSWMRLMPTKGKDSSLSHKWEDVHETLIDLTTSLSEEKRLILHVTELEVTKEGLYQIRDVLMDKNIGYREILTSDEDKVVRIGVKQLDSALGVFKFVMETAGMKGDMVLQGHLRCVGTENRLFPYRGNAYLLRGINL
ncbi:Hypothetical predicted protein [Olea europaea subsp. europaea]|uniref:Uncharacterized protein n=1 Tax=Olea europaea subsp. europaea TaxID=158383 RepID=A0A8S0V835_OLEEU|nr:Hypothetical predicted protein [Olea europaea subsp. europaea]